MNILLVTYTAYPSLSGRITFLTTLKKKLETRGHKVDILAHAPGLNEIYIVGGQRLKKNVLKKQVASTVLPILQARYPDLTSWIQWRETERYTFEEAIRRLDVSGYDIIHVHDIFSSLACQRAITGKPILASFHNCKVEEWKVNMEQGNKSPMELAYVAREEYLSVNRPPKVIVPSKWLQQEFTRLSVPESKFHIVPYGMDVEEFQESMLRPTDIEKPVDRKVILCPARLVLIKGHTYLFQALEQLKAERWLFECWIAGSGALETLLKQEVMKRQLHDVVRFLGARSDIPALLAMADLVVLPTLHDTSPLVIMEAQVAGIPVISTMVGGVPEMIENGKTGLIGPPRDSTFLYHAILEVLRYPLKAKKMAETVKRKASWFWSIDRAVEDTEKIYHELAETYKADSRDVFQPIDEELLEPIHAMGEEKQPLRAGKIIGTVSSKEGYPLTSATVHLMDISQITLQTERCDRNGSFLFSNIPPGKYALIVEEGGRWNSHQLMVREGGVSSCHVSI